MPVCAAMVRARCQGPLRLNAVMIACLLKVPSLGKVIHFSSCVLRLPPFLNHQLVNLRWNMQFLLQRLKSQFATISMPRLYRKTKSCYCYSAHSEDRATLRQIMLAAATPAIVRISGFLEKLFFISSSSYDVIKLRSIFYITKTVLFHP